LALGPDIEQMQAINVDRSSACRVVQWEWDIEWTGMRQLGGLGIRARGIKATIAIRTNQRTGTLEKGDRIDDRTYVSGSSLAFCLVAIAIIADESPFSDVSLASSCPSETRVYSEMLRNWNSFIHLHLQLPL